MTNGDPSEHAAPAARDHIRFYWRPGCPFCMTLERSLNRMKVPYTRHNIWENPAEAAFVRSVANGNETVPTVAIGSAALVNPSARHVATVIRQELPHLAFDDTPLSGRLRSVLRRD
jgi:glutaredoxin-like protein